MRHITGGMPEEVNSLYRRSLGFKLEVIIMLTALFWYHQNRQFNRSCFGELTWWLEGPKAVCQSTHTATVSVHIVQNLWYQNLSNIQKRFKFLSDQ